MGSFFHATSGFKVLALVVSCAGASACGGGSNDGQSSSTGGSTSGAQGGNTFASGTGGAGNSTAVGSGGNAGSNSTTDTNSGFVYLYSLVMTSTSRPALVNASFHTSPAACPKQTYGDCTVTPDCTALPSYVSAGNLTITSPATATAGANDFTMSPNADNTYDVHSLAGPFSGAESMHVAASGATVPAFSVDMTGPLALLLESPAADANGTIYSDRSGDLVLKFTRNAPDVSIVAIHLTSVPVDIECNSAPNANTLTIPKAALDAVQGPIYLLTVAKRNVTAGNFAVTIGMAMSAFLPDKQHPIVVDFKQ